MRRRLTAGLVAAVATVAMAVPATGLATAGGHPHTTPPMCHTHTDKGKHNGKKNASKGNRKGIVLHKGNKCGQPA